MNRRSRRSVSALLISAVATLGLANCGTSSTKTDAASSHAGDLVQLLIGPGDEPGFSQAKAPIVVASLTSWVSAYGVAGVPKQTYAAQLRADGWKSSATVPLTSRNASGGSSVDVLGSPAGAKADQRQTLVYSATATEPVRVTAPGVPGAVGRAGALARMPTAYITWIEGRCMFYLLNAARTPQSLHTFVKPLITAV
jgi:hypothetical protein